MTQEQMIAFLLNSGTALVRFRYVTVDLHDTEVHMAAAVYMDCQGVFEDHDYELIEDPEELAELYDAVLADPERGAIRWASEKRHQEPVV